VRLSREPASGLANGAYSGSRVSSRNPVSRQAAGLVIWFLVVFAAAALGAIASSSADEFYPALSRPSWAPPGSVFGPVWTVLYALQAIAAWLLWRDRGFDTAKTALTLFLVQLVVNALWSWLFFAWRMGAAAFVDVVVLWVLIVATLVAFWRHHRLAAVLLAPYLAWVTFATFLTYAVWQRNPGVL
jgi:benzodiazapine receptor